MDKNCVSVGAITQKLFDGEKQYLVGSWPYCWGRHGNIFSEKYTVIGL